ncbi:MAG: nitrogenase [Methanospirillaceae archaeon]|nr:nitrogenase [Methanospirillaceae archaeon]
MVSFPDGCRIIIALAVTGVVFFEIKKAQCTVWHISGWPEEHFDRIWNETEKENSDNEPGIIIPTPVEISPGCIYLPIREIQGKLPGIRCKQVYQIFFRESNFSILEIIWDHVPPWIELKSECIEYEIKSLLPGFYEVQVLLTHHKN